MARPSATDDRRAPIEITDLLWSVDPATGARLPVHIEAVARRLDANGQVRAARIVRALPTNDGRLDEIAVDALLLRVHRELQRLAEELQLPRRLAEWLVARTEELMARHPDRPVRVVDVGCGLGYVTRWMSANAVLGPRVELVGVDFNAALVSEAQRLAKAERLNCRFVMGDAFVPGVAVDDPARTIVVSSGLMHHIPSADLAALFAAQQRLGVAAFAHWDIDPSRWATLGAWVFHQARMRQRVSRHDGVLSARRAHTAATLLAAARRGAPEYSVSCKDGRRWLPTFSEVLRPIVGDRIGR